MLVPKRVKHRREFRGKMRGEAKGGKEVAFGEYGLQATTSHWITNRQIEAARIAMTRYMKRGGKVWIKIFPHKSYTAKAIGVRYLTRHGGTNYTGNWLHPLTPYSLDSKGEKPPISIKGRQAGKSYREARLTIHLRCAPARRWR